MPGNNDVFVGSLPARPIGDHIETVRVRQTWYGVSHSCIVTGAAGGKP